MKPEEQSAKKFLEKQFEAEAVYEPLGKYTPPDFSIGRAAFEVRRLNQHHESGEPLEQVQVPLELALRKRLAKVQFCRDRGTFFWGLHFGRPLKDKTRTIARKLTEAAQALYLQDGTKRGKASVEISGVTIELIPAAEPDNKAFLMGYIVDNDSGGFLAEVYGEAIQRALAEKIEKTKGIVREFDRWSLVLVDFILPNIMEPVDIGDPHFNLGHFSSFVIINPDGTPTFQWPPKSAAVA